MSMFVCLTLFSSWVRADTWYVNPVPLGAGDCSAPANACASIQKAVTAAMDGDTIDSAASNITIDVNLTLEAQGPDNTIVQAAPAPGVAIGRVFEILVGVTSTIRRLTMRHGHLTGDGGGILNHGDVTLWNCLVSSNRVMGGTLRGGGIYNNGMLTALSCYHQRKPF